MARLLLLLIKALSLIHATVTADCPCDDPRLCQPVQVTWDKEVLGFMIRPDNWPEYNWTELTTIAIFTSLNETNLNRLVCHAHANKVRVVSHTGSEILKLFNESSRRTYITNLLQYVEMHHLDGVNIDAEDPINEASNIAELSQVTKEIYTAFKASSLHYQISFDVAWSPNCIDGRCYDYKELAKWTDFLVVMAYDERSQIFDPGPCLSGANSDFVKTQDGLEQYIKLGIPSSDLVLGLPWYGYDYPCVKVTDDHSPCEIPRYVFRGVNCSDGSGRQIGYSGIINDLLPLSTTGLLYNDTAESPFFTYRNGSSNEYHQVWFDSPRSLSVKYGYAAKMDLRGIAFWNTDTLDYSNDSQRNEMWNAIQAFLTPD